MSLWIGLLIRSAVILISAEAICRLCRRAHAGLRHRVLFLAFGAVLVLPLLSSVLPEVPVQLWHESNGRASVTIEQMAFAAKRGRSPALPVNWPILIWCTGFSLSLVPLVAGSLSMLRIAHRASPLLDQPWIGLLKQASTRLRKPPELFISSQIAVPLTFGLLKPKILLPPDCHEWSDTRRRAVLLHELAHIRRRDLITQSAAHFIAAIWWFQPLVWLILRNLRYESELACDAETIAQGFQPSRYASELLEVARAIKSGVRPGQSSAAISMARPQHLERRVTAILRQSPPRVSRTQAASLIAVLSFVAVTASALTPVSRNSDIGGLHMKRTLFSTLLASVGLSAATVSGSLFDPSGAAIPDAKVLLYNPDTGVKQETTTGADGRFALENAPLGELILRIEKPGFSAILREFNLKPDSKIDKGLTMEVGRMHEELQVQAKGSAVAASQDAPSAPVHIGGQVAQANLVTKVSPVYPAAAKAGGIQGTVKMEAVISMEGVPLDIRVISSPSDDLSEASLEAVRQWRYRPTLLNGNPVEVVTDVIVNYTLAP
jgi:TonB family protein